MKKLVTLILVLAGIVSTASAATETTVYYAVSSETVGTYTVKLNVQLQTGVDNWKNYTMTKIDKTYDGLDIYTCTYTDMYDGVATMQFQLYDGETWKSQEEVISSWTAAGTYNGKIYNSGWKKFRTDTKVYLAPNSNWKEASAWFAIYLEDDNSNSTWEQFTSVDGHDGYYEAQVSGKWTKCVLVRMNSEKTIDAHWDGKWNQCPDGTNRITLQNQDATYTPDNGTSNSYGNSLIPWNYYFMSGTGDTWNAVEAMTNSAGTYTYSFSGATYAGKRVSWAPGTSFWAAGNLRSWDDVCKSKVKVDDDDWISFRKFRYDNVVIGSTGSAWYVPASNDYDYNDGTITITFNSDDKSASITSARTVTINPSVGYATFSYKEDVAIPSGVTAWFAKEVDESKVIMKKFLKCIPYWEGALLQGSGEVTITPAENSNDWESEPVWKDGDPNNESINLLIGYYAEDIDEVSGTSVDGSSDIPYDKSKYFYILGGTSSADVGFYRVTSSRTPAEGKAYLRTSTELASGDAGARAAWIFDEEGETTGINEVKTTKVAEGFFNLAGQRVAKPAKGLYIVNGKKVIMK